MKAILTTSFTILLFAVTCKAQNTFPATGNVGIGTTTPTLGTLQINGNSDLLSFYSTVNNAIQLNAYNNIDFRIIQRMNAPMTFWTNTIERMRIDQSGNVGIGTTTPTSKLVVAPGVVNGSVDQTISLISSAGQNSFGGYIGQRVINGNTRQGLVVSGTGSLTLQAQNYNMDFVTGAVTPTDDTNLRMRILASGNVGIGTATPDQKLSVNGTVHSTVVLVDNTVIPDYVFDKTYALRPLSAVKAYIDLNHHLPEIPSAAEVAKNGQNLGEINTLLLKKVEELTLYMIEKDKQVKALEQQKEILQQQQAQISQLRKQLEELINAKK